MTEYQDEKIYLGDYIRAKRWIRDENGELTDPTSQSWKLYSPDGTIQDSTTTPEPVSKGIYYWDVQIPATGEGVTVGIWKVFIEVTKEPRVKLFILPFEVEEKS